MVVAAVVLGSCFKSNKSTPELFTPSGGLRVAVFESQTVVVQPGGSLHLALETADIAITAISIDTTGRGGNVTVEVASLSGAPTGLDPPHVETIYQYIQIGHDGLQIGSVAVVTIDFEVRRAWLDSNGHRPQDVALERYSGEWTVLPTRITARMKPG